MKRGRDQTSKSQRSKVLKTKLLRPALPAQHVPRPRLVARLDTAAQSLLTLVTAPAGFGKTTLVAEWAASRARDAPEIAWLLLDDRDNDLGRFLEHLVAAVRRVRPDIGENASNLLNTPVQFAAEAVLGALVNDLCESTGELLVVLDDYHAVVDARVHDAMVFLLDAAAPGLRIVIASRSEPPLPLGRWRGRGKLAEVRAADLNFDQQEVVALFNNAGVPLSDDHCVAVTERTQGWVAAVRLAALSITEGNDPRNVVEGIRGTGRHVFDFLATEVFAHQPPVTQSFLLETSILDHLESEVCDAVTGRGDSHALLERLETAGVLIEPLGGEKPSYRYHALFLDFLRGRAARDLPAASLVDLHRRAARWYENRDVRRAALGHALAAGDFDDAARILERSGAVGIGVTADVGPLKRQLEMLPEDVIRARPRLCVFHAWLRLLHGDHAGANERLADVERAVGASRGLPDGQALLGSVAALRGTRARYVGRWNQCVEQLERALDLLAADDGAARGMSLAHLAAGHLWRGDVSQAARVLRTFDELRRVADVPAFAALIADVVRGRVKLMMGSLEAALRIFQRAEQDARRYGGSASPIGAGAEIAIGQVCYERGDLEAAERHARAGLLRARHWIDPLEVVLGHVLLARVLHASAREAEAVEALHAARDRAANARMDWAVSQVNAFAARLDLARGGAGAASWADGYRPRLTDENGGLCDVEQLTLARYLTSRGRFDDAARILAEIRDHAEAANRAARVLEVHALEAVLADAAGDGAKATRQLERALELAAPEGWIRVFADEGRPMQALLSRFLKEQRRRRASTLVPDAFLSRLRHSLEPGGRHESAMGTQNLPEPLSARELEVLTLVSEGASNEDIGRRLHVAVSTVKRHVHNIFGKLGVTNRIEATGRARELRILR